MDKSERKAVREAYDKRHPEMGVVCWRSGDNMWIATSKDTAADYNSTSFQLKLGSWPNREMQKVYNDAPDSFTWSVLRTLDYKEREDIQKDDLELLYMMCLDEYPQAKAMRVGRR